MALLNINSLVDTQVIGWANGPAGFSRLALDRVLLTGSISTTGDVNGASSTEMTYLAGVTSAIQTQIDAKIAESDLLTLGDNTAVGWQNGPLGFSRKDAGASIGVSGDLLFAAAGAVKTASGSLLIKPGTDGDVRLDAANGRSVYFTANGIDRWYMTGGGHWRAQVTNTYDIGTEFNAARSGYFDTSVVTPQITTASGDLTLAPADGVVLGGGQRIKTSSGGLYLEAATTITLVTNSAERWQIPSGGAFQPRFDDFLDIGTGSSRVRSGYFGTSIEVPQITTASGDLTLAPAGNVVLPGAITVAGNSAFGSQPPETLLSVAANLATPLLVRRTGGTNVNMEFRLASLPSWYVGMNTAGYFAINDLASMSSPKLKLETDGTLTVTGSLGLGDSPTISSTGGHTNIVPAGNLGVKTAAPLYDLDVTGDCNVSGQYRVGGTPVALEALTKFTVTPQGRLKLDIPSVDPHELGVLWVDNSGSVQISLG